jgi:hypothetical protein
MYFFHGAHKRYVLTKAFTFALYNIFSTCHILTRLDFMFCIKSTLRLRNKQICLALERAHKFCNIKSMALEHVK